jgi:hypothetical protein
LKKFLVLNVALLLASSSVFAIEDTASKKSWFNFLKKDNANEVVLEKNKAVEEKFNI